MNYKCTRFPEVFFSFFSQKKTIANFCLKKERTTFIYFVLNWVINRSVSMFPLPYITKASNSSFTNYPILLSINTFLKRFISNICRVSGKIHRTVLSTCEVFLLGWQFLVLLSRRISFHFLHLLSAMINVIVCLPLNF